MASRALEQTERPEHYRSLSHFFLSDPRRIGSREHGLGRCWRVGAHGPVYRAAWLDQTGELYVARFDDSKGWEGEVELLGRADDRNQLDHVLRGWGDVCHQPDSMTWLRHRAAALERPARARVSRELPRIELTERRVQHARAAFAQIDGAARSGPALRGQS